MTSVVAGKIRKKAPKKFVVSLFKGKINKTFKTLSGAVNFSRHHCKKLLETKETFSVSVEYTRMDSRRSFLIWETSVKKNEISILEYEECAYDYQRSHSSFYPKHSTRRLANERYYSFHDFARINALTTNFSAYAKITINIIALIFAIIYLFYGLHATNMAVESVKLSDEEKRFFDIFVALGTIFTVSTSISSTISYGYPLYKLRKNNWNYDQLDWRKLNSLRRGTKWFSITIATIGLGLLIYFFNRYIDTPLWQTDKESNEGFVFFVISIIVSSLFIIIGILSIINSLINIKFNKNNLKKYFTPSEIKEYKKWVKFKPAKVAYKTDNNYFILPLKDTIDITLAKMEMISEVEKTSTEREMKEYKRKSIRHYKAALAKYLESLDNDKLEK